MTITIDEQFDSREATESIESPSVDLQYQVKGTENDVDVRNVVEVTIPAFYLGLPFQSYHIKPLGGGVWNVPAVLICTAASHLEVRHLRITLTPAMLQLAMAIP